MVTKTAEEIGVEQEEVVIQAAEIEVAEEVQEKAQVFVDKYRSRLKQMTNAYVQRGMAEAEAGGPVIAGYNYINCLTVGPIQFIFGPPYLPNKIVAAGEAALMLGVIWINPAAGPSGTLPGTTVLGGRPWRARFEGMNLTIGANGPDATFTGTFPGIAPAITPLLWFMPTPNPGANPHLIEMNFTVDITLSGQPFAAFSTWHFDPDFEPAFLRPAMGPHWQFERPARYLLYQQ